MVPSYKSEYLQEGVLTFADGGHGSHGTCFSLPRRPFQEMVSRPPQLWQGNGRLVVFCWANHLVVKSQDEALSCQLFFPFLQLSCLSVYALNIRIKVWETKQILFPPVVIWTHIHITLQKQMFPGMHSSWYDTYDFMFIIIYIPSLLWL